MTKANRKENDTHIEEEIRNAEKVIISWGRDAEFEYRRKEAIQLIKNSELSGAKVFSIRFVDKEGNIYDPEHLSRHITDNPPNYELRQFSFG